MAANATEGRSRVTEALGFWLVTLLICGIAGLASYKFGRDWIGDRLGGEVKPILTTQELAHRVGAAAQDEPPTDSPPSATPAEPPPQKAVVDITPVAPTVEDRQQLRLEGHRQGAASRDDSASAGKPDSTDTEKPGASGGDSASQPDVPDTAAQQAHQKEPSAPATPAAEESAGRYTVRAGSFADRANADRLIAKLRAQGYQPFVSRVVKDGREYNRVNVATVAGKEDALKLRSELRSAGYAADISSE
jgi:cell division protein FtsN